MPTRPDSHVIADIAVNKVMSLCGQCGWACEVVHKDYGDDILVQPSYKERVDHNRIWIQVKGTRNIDRLYSQKYGYSIDVSLDHALKWIRSSDLSIVVLWDIEKDFGLWSIPKDNIDEWDLVMLQKNQSRLIFPDTNQFNLDQLDKIGWLARVRHYSMLINETLTVDHFNEPREAEISSDNTKYRSYTPLIAFDFLRLIGVVENNSLSSLFFEQFRNVLSNINRSNQFGDEKSKIGAAISLIIFNQLNSLSNGCPIYDGLWYASINTVWMLMDNSK